MAMAADPRAGGEEVPLGAMAVGADGSQGPDGMPLEAAVEALRTVGLSKSYGFVQAARQVSFTVSHGEVVALVGDNGAGKSTLVKMISGVIVPDEGEIYVDGQLAAISSPLDAAAYGIRTIHQDLALADNLDVVENLFLGRELERGRGPFPSS